MESAIATCLGRAIERLRQQLPDVLITDYFLPNLDGGKLCQLAKRLAGDSEISTIILTGGANANLSRRPSRHADAVIAKNAIDVVIADLSRTLALVHSYLKPGGTFLFSWEHPAYHSLRYEMSISKYVFEASYLDESPELDPSWKGVEIVINHRKLSTYLNAIIQSGLVIDRVIESEPNMGLAREQDFAPEKWYSIPRAQLMPTTFIVKAHKPI